MPEPCRVEWCAAFRIENSEWCAIHHKYPELRKDNHQRSIQALRDEQSRQRRVKRNEEQRAATERARQLNRERLIRRG